MSLAALWLAASLGAQARAAHPHRIELLPSAPAKGKGVEVMAEEALVRFDDTADPSFRRAALEGAGLSLESRVGRTPWHLVYLPAGMTVANGLSLLKVTAGVVDAQPNNAYRPLKMPNDPRVASQWHLGNVNAFAAWEYSTSSSNVNIALIDTGVQASHPDLAGNLDKPRSRDCSSGTCSAENPPRYACRHGTRVAGVAAAVADNGVGVAGAAWNAKLVSLRVFPDGACTPDCGDEAENSCATSDAAIAAALGYAQSLPAPVVVNISVGARGSCPGAVQSAVASAFGAGVTLFAAAGNDGGPVNAPGNCDYVIPVGAADRSNSVAAFSSRGPELADNGLVAPGVDLVTTDVDGGYAADANGTSFSSALVSGLAALMLSARSSLDPAQVRQYLRASASDVAASTASPKPARTAALAARGAGLVNAFLAVRFASVGGTLDEAAKAIASPIPFRPAREASVGLGSPGELQGPHALIQVYTQSGRLVRTLPGRNGMWDGNDDAGLPVAAGSYFFVVSGEKGHTVGRVEVIR